MATNNTTILDAIYLDGSNDYRQTIPLASQVGVDKVFESLSSSTNARYWNEFNDNLHNMFGNIIFSSSTWSNHLAFLKKDGYLGRFGVKIEEIAVGLIESEGYDIRKSNIFAINEGRVESAVHTLNRQDQWKISVSRPELAQAFMNETGLESLVNLKIAKLKESAEYSEYTYILELVDKMWNDENMAAFNQQVTFADPLSPTDTELKRLSIEVRKLGKLMTLTPKPLYNPAGVPRASRREDLFIITTPMITANLDVNVLADAFNMSRTDFVDRLVEVDELPDGLWMVIAEKDKFIIADTLNEMTTFFNPKTLVTTYFHNKWSLFSLSPFANAATLSNRPTSARETVVTTRTNITAALTDYDGNAVSTYKNGDEVQLVVTNVGTITPENDKLIVPGAYGAEITIVDADAAPINANNRSYVRNNGIVKLQKLPVGAVVTVTAKSTGGEDFTATATLTVA